MIKILIADDHAMIRQSIGMMLQSIDDIEVVGEAKSGEEAVKLSRQVKPNVVLMDVRMPGIGGLEATRRLLELNSQIQVIGLSGYNDGSYPSLFINAGAMGYITKDAGVDDMLTAIRSACQGKVYLSPAIQQRVAESSNHSDNPFNELSDRERQVCLMLLESYQHKEVAQKLDLSERSIKTYRHRIFEKLNVKNDIELTLLALRFKMIEPEN